LPKAGGVVTKAWERAADQSHPAVGAYQYLRDDTDCRPLLPPKVANPANATDFLFVPYTLESLISYGIFVCLDSLLFVFTALPIRAAIALYHLLLRGRKLHALQKVDVLKTISLVLGYLFLRLIDIPSLSQFMVKESLLKIKYLITLLVVMDKLMSSYGKNIMGSLFWAINQPAHKVKHGYYWHFILSIIYMNMHAAFLLGYIAVMDVAMEGEGMALLSLLILIQYAEMKSAVLKEITEEKLWIICYNDIVERFQLLVSLVLLFFYNISKHHINSFWDEDWLTASEWMSPLLFTLFIIYLSELTVDWLKHTSIINFTDLGPRIYTKLAHKISKRLGRINEKSFLSDRTQNIASTDLGATPLPLGVLVMKVVGDWIPSGQGGLALLVCLYFMGLLVRFILGVLLAKYTSRFRSRPNGHATGKQHWRNDQKQK
jgi:hypothetical protein